MRALIFALLNLGMMLGVVVAWLEFILASLIGIAGVSLVVALFVHR